MRGFRINPDKDFVFKIIEGTERKNGHCPCKISQDDFLKEGICKCKLFVPIEEDEKKQ